MKKIFLVATLFVALFTSCKKDKPFDLSGTTFKGTYALQTNPTGSAEITFTFNADGSLKAVNSLATFAGTWNKSSSVVNIFLPTLPIILSIKAVEL